MEGGKKGEKEGWSWPQGIWILPLSPTLPAVFLEGLFGLITEEWARKTVQTVPRSHSLDLASRRKEKILQQQSEIQGKDTPPTHTHTPSHREGADKKKGERLLCKLKQQMLLESKRNPTWHVSKTLVSDPL